MRKDGIPSTMDLMLLWADLNDITIERDTSLWLIRDQYKKWLTDLGLDFLYKESPINCFRTFNGFILYKERRSKPGWNWQDFYKDSPRVHLRAISFQDTLNYVRKRAFAIFKEAWEYHLLHKLIFQGKDFSMNFQVTPFMKPKSVYVLYLGREEVWSSYTAFEFFFPGRINQLTEFLKPYLDFIRYEQIY